MDNEKFVINQKINKVKSLDAQLHQSVLTESITDLYLKRRDAYNELTECAKLGLLDESAMAEYETLTEDSKKVDYDYYSKMLDAQYKKLKKYIKDRGYTPNQEFEKLRILDKRYDKAKKYFDKMKNSDDVLTKIKRFFDVDGAISQGKIRDLMDDYLLKTDDERLDTRLKKSQISRNLSQENKNNADFARGFAEGFRSMNDSVSEFEALISDPMDELDAFIVNECASEFDDPYALIESAYDKQYDDPICAAQELIDAANILKNNY